ncbi:hypothetical protein PIB30_003918 [Stylosanthes scabra]|uniref:Uncharacterized protein n=1 Tax=Stylosanthes scabra TaxID=79078 RepID=A0ABU6U2H7_9FABA|nr:hypothetical protein [Stylosanthes scabra]
MGRVPLSPSPSPFIRGDGYPSPWGFRGSSLTSPSRYLTLAFPRSCSSHRSPIHLGPPSSMSPYRLAIVFPCNVNVSPLVFSLGLA